MKRELKRQIKEDELKTGLEHAWEWVQARQDQLRIGAAVVVLVGAVIGGIAYFQSQRRQEAERDFAAAVEIFEAPRRSELAEGTPAPAGPVFASAEEKYRKAAAAFDGVERKYPSLPAGVRARYFGALCRIELRDFAEARKVLGEMASRREPGALEPALARLALAEVERRSGALDKAIEAYKQLVEDASLPVPRDHALMSLGELFEDAKRAPEAQASYQRLTEEFPDSVYAPEARRRARYLKTPSEG